MIWLPRTTDNLTYFAQSLEIRGIESRLYLRKQRAMLRQYSPKFEMKFGIKFCHHLTDNRWEESHLNLI